MEYNNDKIMARGVWNKLIVLNELFNNIRLSFLQPSIRLW